MLARLLQCPSGQAIVRKLVGGVDGLDSLVAEASSSSSSSEDTYFMGYYPVSALRTELALGAALERATVTSMKPTYGAAFRVLSGMVAREKRLSRGVLGLLKEFKIVDHLVSEIQTGHVEGARLLYLVLFYGVETTIDGEDVLASGAVVSNLNDMKDTDFEASGAAKESSLPALRLDTEADDHSRDTSANKLAD